MSANKFLRKCVACGIRTEKNNLIRLAKLNSQVFIDVDKNKDGRGAYICKNHKCFQKAVKNRSLYRALKVEINEDLLRELEKYVEGEEEKHEKKSI